MTIISILLLVGGLLAARRNSQQQLPRRRNVDFFTDELGRVRPVRGTLGYLDEISSSQKRAEWGARSRAKLAEQRRRRGGKYLRE